MIPVSLVHPTHLLHLEVGTTGPPHRQEGGFNANSAVAASLRAVDARAINFLNTKCTTGPCTYTYTYKLFS